MKTIKTVKFIQLGLTIIFDIFFFLILFLNKTFRYTIFINKTLFLICVLLWIFSVGTIAFIVFDIKELLVLEINANELSNEANFDKLTGIPNRHSFDKTLKLYEDSEKINDLGCILFKIANIHSINDSMGREQGDTVIKAFSKILEQVVFKYGSVGRNGGNDYIALVDNASKEIIENIYEEINQELSFYNKNNSSLPIEMESAYMLNSITHFEDISELISAVYMKMGI